MFTRICFIQCNNTCVRKSRDDEHGAVAKSRKPDSQLVSEAKKKPKQKSLACL
jgi:hypothetical protein